MKYKKPDPDKLSGALERTSLDTPRQYDDRKTLAWQVIWQADEIKRLRAERSVLSRQASKIGKCDTCDGTVLFMSDGERLCGCHTAVERTQEVSDE